MTRLVFISDTHEMHEAVTVPACDILVHCGDATGIGRVDQLERFNAWCRRLKKAGTCREVVFVAGNHDILLDETHSTTVKGRLHGRAMQAIDDVIYLEDEAAEVLGVRFYGSPWTPKFFDWGFMLRDEVHAEAVFSGVPTGLDVLVTHGPAGGILDLCPDGRRVGSVALNRTVERARPKIHAFGHIHHSHGEIRGGGVHFINASICTEAYKPTNAPIVVDLDRVPS